MSFYNHHLLENRSTALREKGAALVVTLLVVVLLATIVAGFLAATRLEQSASRNFTYQNVAENMAQMAAQQAIAQLNRDVATAISNSTPLTTMPGAAFQSGNLIILSSASAPGASSNSTNANPTSSMSGFGIIHSNTNANLFRVPLVDVTNQMHGTNIYGRYAYWVDDDGSRANLNSILQTNSASATTRSNYFPFYPANSNPRILDPSVFSGVAADLRNLIRTIFSNTNSTNPWPYFMTPRQVSITNITVNGSQQLLTQVAAGPANLGNIWHYTNTIFTGRKINLNDNLTTTNINNVNYAVNFIQIPQGSTSLSQELDDLINEKIDHPDNISLFGSSFTQKYGSDVLRQIVVNINDLNLATGAAATPSETATTGSGNTNSLGIPTGYSGLRRFIHLNEIACKAAYSTNSPCGSRVEFQIWFSVELVNPYSSDWGAWSQIKLGISDFSAALTYLVNGNSTTTNISFSTPQPNSSSPAAEGIRVNTEIGARSYSANNLTFAFEYQAYPWDYPPNASNFSVSQISFRPNYVKLLQWANADQTIRDWATSEDFSRHGPNGLLVFNNPPLVSGGILSSVGASANNTAPPSASISNFNIGSLGIAKNDPRVRPFESWSFNPQAWSWVGGGSPNSVTIGSANTGTVNFNAPTGRPNISSDRTTAAPPNIFAHPSLANAFTATLNNLPYRSVMELGKVHTGLQWRTLQMTPQSPSETAAGLIPDWALLETFKLTNALQTNVANPIVKMNINSVHYPAATNVLIADQSSGGLLRATALQSLLSGGTILSNSTNTSNGSLSLGIPFASRMLASGPNSPSSIATNISRLAFNANWASGRPSSFPTNAFASIGEVLEISNVANFSTDDSENEGRAAAFIDAITTYSDIFSIYSIGYAVDRTGATVAEFAMRTQVQFDPTTGRFRTVFSEPLR